MTDKKSCNHSTKDDMGNDFDFCPNCGKALKSSPLDRFLLKTFGLESQDLNPGQSIGDAIEAFFYSQSNRDWLSIVSFDRVQADKEKDPLAGEVWEVGIRGMLFQDYSLKKAFTKALLWAVTPLTTEDVEELFKKF